MSNKRIRGVAVHRPIIYGSTSTPLTPADKLSAPPDHTHKWTVSVRSAASHPLPSLPNLAGLPSSVNVEHGSEHAAMTAAAGDDSASASASVAPTTPGGGATISTRGRDQEHDYHKMVGGKDDISHFIKRVQFKLHDTYPQATRNVDKPPFSVTETGWGEFEIQIKVFFVAEANEKPLTLFHHLKLHPWLNVVAAAEQVPAVSVDTAQNKEDSSPVKATETATEAPAIDMDVDEPTKASEGDQQVTESTIAEQNGVSEEVAAPSAAMTPAVVPDASLPKPILPPVVHSWQYDEIVFPEPMEAFYEVLTAHPPTPLPTSSAQAFMDPAAYRSYQHASQAKASDNTDAQDPKPIPPHPLHTPTGYLFDALSLESQQGEADRLEMARIAAVKEIEAGREELIKAERALKEIRSKLSAFPSIAALPASGTAPPLTTTETDTVAV